MRLVILVVLVFATVFTFATAFAQHSGGSSVPNLLQFSGTLTPSDSGGSNSKIEGVTFTIYSQQEGGAPLWLETQNFNNDSSGRYTVLLGSDTSDSDFSDLPLIIPC